MRRVEASHWMPPSLKRFEVDVVTISGLQLPGY